MYGGTDGPAYNITVSLWRSPSTKDWMSSNIKQRCLRTGVRVSHSVSVVVVVGTPAQRPLESLPLASRCDVMSSS